MEALFLALLVVLTSVGACAIGSLVFGLSIRRLGPAVRQTLEVAGFTVVFLVANLGIGLAVVLSTRALAMRFISVYILNDASLIALSALQGVIASWWLRSAPASRADEVRHKSA